MPLSVTLAAFGVLGIGIYAFAASTCSPTKSSEPSPSAAAQTPPAKDTAAAVAQAASAEVERYTAGTAANFADASVAQRELGIRQCVEKGDACHDGTLEGIVASAKSEKERDRLTSVEIGAEMQAVTAKAQDGTEMSESIVATDARLLLQGGAKVLATMPTTTYAAASKDGAAERGKVMSVAGNVVEIKTNRGAAFGYEGTIMTDAGGFVRFVCPLTTEGIVDGTWARFKGVFVQEYDYPNVAGGETKSLLLVGAFNP